MTFIGSGFNFAYGDYVDDSLLDNPILTGFLADGTAINNTVYIDESATITLAAVPEPSTLSLLTLGTLMLLRPRQEVFGSAVYRRW